MAPAPVGPGGCGQAAEEGIHGLRAPEPHEELLATGVDFGSQAGVAVNVGRVSADKAVKGRSDAFGAVIRCEPRLNSGHIPDRPIEHAHLGARGAPGLRPPAGVTVYSAQTAVRLQ